jgi:G2/mitotic-specific cyclin-B, other
MKRSKTSDPIKAPVR